MNETVLIKDLIDVPPVQTVIRLEESRTNPEQIAASFVFTDEVTAHFTVIADAVINQRGQGYFLQGDFGSGKSHFLAALSTWLAGEAAAGKLSAGHRGLQKLQAAAGKLLPVNISLVRYRASTSLEQIIVLAIDDALLAAGFERTITPLSGFLVHLQELLQDSYLLSGFAAQVGLPEQEVAGWIEQQQRQAFQEGIRFIKDNGVAASEILFGERYETFQQAMEVIHSQGYAGLFLIIDELSEFLRSKPAASLLNEDARTLQLLGELSQTQPLWIIAALQESIEKTGDIAQATLRKIKDRYPVRLSLSTVHIRSLVAGRLVVHKAGADEVIREVYQEYKNQFSDFSAAFDEFRAIYPIHPETIRMLDGLSDLFSQHRGIVDFVYSRVGGNSSKNIPGIMQQTVMQLLGPDSIYDHFESRIAEFSSFNQYPRQILPHFRDVIEQVIPKPEDRQLALRLIKILILYAIHPTAVAPPVRKLTELVALTLFMQQPEMNTRFVAEAILDRIADRSRFLVKQAGGDPADAVYSIVAAGDPGKVLDSHLARALEELAEDDTRLLTEPLAELPATISWPGHALMTSGLERTINWLGSERRAFLRFLWQNEKQLVDHISYQTAEGKYDLAVIFLLHSASEEAAAEWPENIALWRITIPRAMGQKLKEYFALKSIQAGLNPANPADAQIIDGVREKAARLKPEALQLALECFYAGSFIHPPVELNQAIRQIKNFDRLLEKAAAELLEKRYPHYKSIMPRRIEPSLHKYRLLLEHFILPGVISLKNARELGIHDPIEGIALPLGLVEQKGSNYLFSPALNKHHFLVYFFSLLKPSGKTELTRLLENARLGEYGITEELFHFLLVCLCHAGLVALLKNDRIMPLEMVNLQTVATATHLAPGELISKSDQQTLLTECSFLLPAETYETFGLRQQRDVWKNVIQLKEKFERQLGAIENGFRQYAGYSALQVLNQEEIRTRLKAFKNVVGEIRVSYPAKEGLERFIQAFRGSGLGGGDVTFLAKLQKFFSGYAEKFVFLYHYLSHTQVEKACSLDDKFKQLRDQLLGLCGDAETNIILGEGEYVNQLFLEFREAYFALYSRLHNDYYKSFTKPVLSRDAKKAYTVLKQLATVETLDRPAGLLAFFEYYENPLPVCRRQVVEELLRSPVCSCGFQTDTAPRQQEELPDPQQQLESYMAAYLEILRQPRIKQALTAQAYALEHAEPEAAGKLSSMLRTLSSPNLSPANLLHLFDELPVTRLASALQGNLTIVNRELSSLVQALAGRRLTLVQINRLIENWLACREPDTLIAVNTAGVQSVPAQPEAEPAWWLALHPELAEFLPAPAAGSQPSAVVLEQALARKFPAEGLKEAFYRMPLIELLAFILKEVFHFAALQQALLIFAEKILKTDAAWPMQAATTPAYPDQTRAGLVSSLLALLQQIKQLQERPFPDCLAARLAYEQLYYHSFATSELQHQILAEIEQLARAGEQWLAALAPVPAINLEEHPLVLILDGVPVDVWLKLLPAWGDDDCQVTWYALAGKPLTVEALAGLLGVTGDPLEILEANSIAYESLAGNEERRFQEILGSAAAGRAMVVRFALVDRQAHSGTLRLAEMAGQLAASWEGDLRQALAFCRERCCPLLLTTDHGLSFTARGYTHGKGGVFERAVPVVRWEGAESG